MSTLASEDARTFQGITAQKLVRQIEEEPALRQRLAALLAEAQRPRMTYEEFLEWADEDTWAEWVDGEVIMLTLASPDHQRISRFLLEVLSGYARAHDLGEIFHAPMQMKLERGREPDLLFVAREHLERLKKSHMEGPADLAVEIVSPDSIARDRGEKFYEYEAGGVREYWLLDPDRCWAEFYQLGAEGRYRTVLTGAQGVYHSEVLPGFWLRVEWLWQEPLPSPIRALAEIVGMDVQVLEAFERALAGEG